MGKLEDEVAALKARVAEFEKRLRLHRVAESFPETPIGPEDVFVRDGVLYRLNSIDPDGEWNYSSNGIGWSGPRPDGELKRLYTHEEVCAIVAARAKGKKR